MTFNRLTPMVAFAFGISCKSDQKLQELKYDDVAVVSGDFDHMAEILVRLDISYTDFEGYIERAIYDEEIDPDINSLKVEGLFHGENDEGVPTINTYERSSLTPVPVVLVNMSTTEWTLTSPHR